jgi:hypothetical protein
MPATQTEIEFRSRRGGASQNDRLRSIFLACPGVWLAMPTLAREIGAYAVHSRVSDLRIRYGMRIETSCSVDPYTGQRHSAYRYLPFAAPLQTAGAM